MVQEVFFFTEMAYSSYPQDVAAQRGYTALMLPNSYFDPGKAHELYQGYFEEYLYASEIGFIWKLYAETAAEEGYQASSENYGYMNRICAADSDAEAYELWRNFYWQLGRTFGRVPLHWQRPPGYMSRAAMNSQQMVLRDAYGDIGCEQAQDVHQVITGTPDSIIPKLQKVIDVVNPARLVLLAPEGPMSHAAAMPSLELLGREVIPAIKGYQPSSGCQPGTWENIS